MREHPVFKRRGVDLFSEAPIPFTVAALGGKCQVPVLGGATEIDVPAGVQPGHTFRLRGRGMPNLDAGQLGDLYVIASIAVPTDLTPRQRELLRELAAERSEQVNAHKSIFQKVKEAVEDVVDDIKGKDQS